MSEKEMNVLNRAMDFYNKHFVSLFVVKIFIVGLILRVVFQNSSLSEVTENEALSLLLGHDFQEGRLSAFRYGHNFAGTIEYVLTAPLVWIFGTTGLVAKIVPLGFMFATSLVVWFGFKRTPYRDKTRIAMALLWIWPTYFFFATSILTGYISALILVYVSILASAYFAAHSLINKKYFYLFSFLAGIGVWVYPLSFIFSFVCYFWIIKSAPTLKQQRIRALSIFVLGSSFWWAKTIADKATNWTRFYEDQVGPTKIGSGNNIQSFAEFIGLKINSKTWIYSDLNFVLVLILTISFAAILSFLVLGASRAYKTKDVDFANLNLRLVIAQVAVAIIYSFFSIELGPQFFIGLAFPFIFTTIFYANTKSLRIIIGLSIFLFSTIAFYSNVINAESLPRTDTSKVSKVLEREKITRAIASNDISYLITLESKNEITVSPFDFNAFDQKRENIVAQNTQAIIVNSDEKEQRDLAFCIQGALGESFKRISVNERDIYIVPKNLRSEVFEIKNQCNRASDS